MGQWSLVPSPGRVRDLGKVSRRDPKNYWPALECCPRSKGQQDKENYQISRGLSRQPLYWVVLGLLLQTGRGQQSEPRDRTTEQNSWTSSSQASQGPSNARRV